MPSTRGARRAEQALLAPAPTATTAFPDDRAEQLRALLHRSPRDFGHPTSLWTLDLAAEVSCAQGLTPTASPASRSASTLAPARHRLAAGQAVDHQPRPRVRTKKRRRDRLIAAGPTRTPTGCWASRTRSGGAGWRQPHLHAWAEATSPCGWSNRRSPKTIPIRKPWPATACCAPRPAGRSGLAALPRRPARQRPDDPVPGLVLPKLQALGVPGCCSSGTMPPGMSVRRCAPGSAPTTGQVKQQGQGVRILVCYLPVKSPWLNPIEPKWVHSKRAIVEPTACSGSGAGRPRLRLPWLSP